MAKKRENNSSVLVVDIGNTSVSISVVSYGNILAKKLVGTDVKINEFRKKFSYSVSSLNKQEKLRHSVVCSVVPRIEKIVIEVLRKTLDQKPLIVGKDMKVPIKNCYKKPKQVGQDRLVCGYAAKELYGCPVIVIDLGTAITIDAISKKGEYKGGIIIPGIRLSTQSLFKNTALLPDIAIERPRHVIGQDTKESILSGIFYGYGSLLDGLIGLVSTKVKGKPRVILTGGYAKLMKGFIKKKIHKIDPDLVFKGLELVFRKK